MRGQSHPSPKDQKGNMKCTNCGYDPNKPVNPKLQVAKTKKPTFDSFLSHSEIKDLLERACTVDVWDYHNALGCSIKEKYESLYCRLMDVTKVLIRKGASGYFWIVCGPETGSIFQTMTSMFDPNPEPYDEEQLVAGQIPMGMGRVRYEGLLNLKWRVYVDEGLDNEILVGCNDTLEQPSHYAKIQIANFV